MSNGLKKTADALVRYYEGTFAKHGPTLAGVDWLKAEDALLRYALHVRAIDGRPVGSLLDVGCGCGHFLEFLSNHSRREVRDLAEGYIGVDAHPEMIAAAAAAYPGHRFYCERIEDGLSGIDTIDFAVANGLFTVKSDCAEIQMSDYVDHCLSIIWSKCRIGMSFNLMSSSVDYRYERLHYVSPAALIDRYLPIFGRRFAIFHDSRLFDYVCVWVKDGEGVWR